MYVPVRIRELIDTTLAHQFKGLQGEISGILDGLEKVASKYVVEMIRYKFYAHFTGAMRSTDGIIESRLAETMQAIQELLTEEVEGRGEIIIVEVLNSPAHTGLLKITQVSGARGAKAHRLSRLQGEFPRSKIACHYALGFRRRLYAEEQILSRLRALEMATAGSKWFEIELEFARKVLLDEKRAEDFRS